MRLIDVDAVISHFDSQPPNYYTSSYIVSVLKAAPAALTGIYGTCKPFHKCLGEYYSLVDNPSYSYCPYCGKKVETE